MLIQHDKPPKKGMFQAIKDSARNETIEECAKLVERDGERFVYAPHIAQAIRELKETD